MIRRLWSARSTRAVLLVVLVMDSDALRASDETTLRSAYTREEPKIDGRIETKEWAAADSLVLTARDSKERCIVLILNDAENLYVAFSAVDDRTNARGKGAFDNVAVWVRGEIGYWLYGDGKLRTERIDAPKQHSTPFASFADGAATGPSRAPHMAYELLVPFDEIGAEPGATIAVGLHYWDGYDRGPSFWWPAGVDVFTPDGYGELTVATKPK